MALCKEAIKFSDLNENCNSLTIFVYKRVRLTDFQTSTQNRQNLCCQMACVVSTLVS